MWPLAAPFQAEVVPVSPHDVAIGDLVVFVSHDQGRLWLHRVVAIFPEGVRTRGDTVAMPDPLVPWSAVVGRVDAIQLRGARLPLTGPIGPWWRLMGQSWAQIAPGMRRWYRQRVLARTRVDP